MPVWRYIFILDLEIRWMCHLHLSSHSTAGLVSPRAGLDEAPTRKSAALVGNRTLVVHVLARHLKIEDGIELIDR